MTVAVLNNATTGAYTYTPTAPGTYTFSYKVNDGTVDSNTVTVTVLVTSLIVTSTADSEDNNFAAGQNTLREAIAHANAGDTITFDPSIAGQTISLNSQLTIDKNLTIDATDQSITITNISNASADATDDRIIEVTGSTTTFKNLTLTNADITNAIATEGAAILISSGATAVLENMLLKNNSAESGAAVACPTGANGTLQVKNTTFYNNTASNEGGALHIADGCGATLNNTTFVSNTASDGAAVAQSGTGTINLQNSLIADSIGNPCFGTITSITNFVDNDATNSCSASLTGDPLLGSLADNEGDTQTFALLTGSPDRYGCDM